MEYGLIGAKLGHSYSKIIHEMLLPQYPYELHPLPTEAEARQFLEQRPFQAINVTIPYKQLVIPYCEAVDERASAIGAVNTIVNRDGKLYGHNTDFGGFLYMVKAHGVSLRDKTVLILGTGGTHNTVAAVCRSEGAAEILTVSRRAGEGQLDYAQAAARTDVQIVVNTTPAGMYPDNGGCLLELGSFDRLEAVFDVVYNPFRTELLLRAEERGAVAVCGFEMLVAQAVYAAEYFHDAPIDHARIGEIHKALKAKLCNISIVGMPSSGKTTIGKALAEKLGKTFVDLDEEIVRRAGKSIPDIFAQEGEAAFRRLETEAAAEAAKHTGQVISCGGGIVKTPGNARLLRQNGPVLWICRPLEALTVGGGRPLSSSREALEKMEAERLPLYRAAADGIVENSGSLNQAITAAEEVFYEILDSERA